jgi:NitT/TauT family transport system permease protein
MTSLSALPERVLAFSRAPAVRGVLHRRVLDAGLAFAAGAAWALLAVVILNWPDLGDWGRGPELAYASFALAALLILSGALRAFGVERFAKLKRATPWLFALGVIFSLWEAASAKFGWLPQPFFPPPHAILEVFTDDWPKLFESVVASVKLEFLGFALGASVGFVVGVGLGRSRAFGYWVHPVLRLIGPLPAIAWLPIAFFAFPSSWSASIFLIGLTTGFPVAVLTWSGVASVNTAYYDIARMLGASRWFLISKVAIPAALPQVFVGLFMGLAASFAVLVTAEMMGVKAGLGFYLQWAQGWAAYANMYAALIVMSLMCTTLITLLFKLRDRVLSYQKADLRW